MSEKKVFISGSISIKKLNHEIVESLESIISKNYTVLVGDAPGIDTLIQDYFNRKNYYNVEIYSITSFPRYKANIAFQSKYIEVSNEIKKERERQTHKDKAMSEDSNFSLVIWDGSSKGSFSNILRALEYKKYVKVYYSLQNSFLEQSKLTKEEIEFIFRTNNGYTASEVVEYLMNNGTDKFKKTQELNKYLLENKIIKKEDKIYLPDSNYQDLMIVDYYRGQPKGIRFTNDFIAWIESHIVSRPTQGELF